MNTYIKLTFPNNLVILYDTIVLIYPFTCILSKKCSIEHKNKYTTIKIPYYVGKVQNIIINF
jgi:hypothetical protein